MSDGSGMTVLSSSASKFRIVKKDVESVKRVLAANVVVYFCFVCPDKMSVSLSKLYS